MIALLLSVALARLSIWDTHPRSRPYTLGLVILAAGNALTLPGADDHIDPALAETFGSQNITDRLNALCVVSACYLYGLINLRALTTRRWTWAWTAAAIAVLATLITAGQVGDLSSTPVDYVFGLRDTYTTAYLAAMLGFAAVTCVLVLVGAARAFRTSRPELRRALIVLTTVGVAGSCYVGIGIIWLLAHPAWIAEHQRTILAVGPAVVLTGIAAAGLSGLVDAMLWRRRHRPAHRPVGAALGLIHWPIW